MNLSDSKLGVNKVYIDDCFNVLPKIEDESIDLIFADPPYNISKKKGLGWKYSKHITMQEGWDMFGKDEFFKFNKEWITKCVSKLKQGGSLWVCGSFHSIYQIGFIIQNFTDLKLNNSIIWFKPNAQPNITRRFFTESTEQLIWASKNGKKKWTFNYDLMRKMNNGKQMRNLWIIPLTPKSEKSAGIHPTQKPIELLKRIILACTKEGDTVLDPFAGSGTTLVVAKMLNRNYIGIEKEKKYEKIILKRLNLAQKRLPEYSKVEIV